MNIVLPEVLLSKSSTLIADDDRHKSTESFCYYFIF